MPLVMNVLEPLTTYSDPSAEAIAVVRIEARSDPMPGSVIPSAVISEPSAIPGSQRAALLLVAEVQEVRQADVVVERDPEPRAGDPA